MRYSQFNQPQSLKALFDHGLGVWLPLFKALFSSAVLLSLVVNTNFIITSLTHSPILTAILSWGRVFFVLWLLCYAVIVADGALRQPGERVDVLPDDSEHKLTALFSVLKLLSLAALSFLVLMVIFKFIVYLVPYVMTKENQLHYFFLLLAGSLPFLFFLVRFIFVVPLVVLRRMPLFENYRHSLELTVSTHAFKGALAYFCLSGYVLVSALFSNALIFHDLAYLLPLADCLLLSVFLPLVLGMLLLAWDDLELRYRMSEPSVISS